MAVFEGLHEDLFGFAFVFAVESGGVVGLGFVGGDLAEGAVDGGGAAEEVVLDGGVLEGGNGVVGGVGVEGEHVDDGVGLDVGDGGFKGFVVVAIDVDGLDLCGEAIGGLAAVDQDGGVIAVDELFDDWGAD